MGYHIINITHFDKIWLYKDLAELRKGEMLMTFTGGERCKRWVGGFESFFFLSIHFSGFSYEFGALRYEFGALREAEEICCQAFNVFFYFLRGVSFINYLSVSGLLQM